MTDLLARRANRLGPNVPIFYENPVHLVRGSGVWLWDAQGKRYLDCYNNVPHVGHCHPRVVEAIGAQAATLNTHTRYLHEGILDYGDRLVAKFDHGLSQVMMVCTGSEANDVALRMAQAATGKTGVIATDNTYHGNTTATAQLSTRRPPIGGYPPNVRLVAAPVSGEDGAAFGARVREAIADLEATEFGFSGMMFCPVFANEGLPAVAPGFFADAAAHVKAAGGVLLCDEVQPGFGRIGSHWWGHDWLGVVPDVVTLGKPMANGHPVAAVVARPDIMAAFREAFGYFNTFGGNPVSCAAASATLDVIEEDGLVDHAQKVGAFALEQLKSVTHPAIKPAHGLGLFLGLELVQDDAPATELAARVVEEMRVRGVLINRIGRAMNILKLRPPMPITKGDIEFAMEALQSSLDATR